MFVLFPKDFLNLPIKSEIDKILTEMSLFNINKFGEVNRNSLMILIFITYYYDFVRYCLNSVNTAL